MNRLEIIGQVLECEPLRHTPAGLPALEMVLAHESEVVEAGHPRRVELTVQAVALGDLASMLAGTQLGTVLHVQGFLAPARKGSTRLRLHMQQARPIQAGRDPVVA